MGPRDPTSVRVSEGPSLNLKPDVPDDLDHLRDGAVQLRQAVPIRRIKAKRGAATMHSQLGSEVWGKKHHSTVRARNHEIL